VSGKVLDLDVWFNFCYEIFNHWIGYINAVLILLIETYFLVVFLLGNDNLKFIWLNIAFVSFLTLIVIFLPNVFGNSCLCFGKLIEIPEKYLFAKNIVLLFLLVIYLVARRKVIKIKLRNQKNENKKNLVRLVVNFSYSDDRI
jgi:hypothetical protein